MARLRDLRRAGASVGLGTDGIAVTGQDMFECMKQSVLLQRAHTGDPVASTVEEAMELATREGARYAGIDAGVLAPGKLADVAVVNLSNVHTRPVHRTVAALVYSARASDVEMTIVGGRVVYEGGRCVLVDEQELLDEADARAAELVERAGMTRAHESLAPAARSASTWSGCSDVLDADRPHGRRPSARVLLEHRQELLRTEGAWFALLDRHPPDRRLQERVGRRRHAVQAPEQHDLAVQVVDLGAARPAQQALRRRAAHPAGRRPPGATVPSRRGGGRRTSASSVQRQPAAAKHASPSVRARVASARASSLRRSAQAASIAFPRFRRSLARFQARTSGSGRDENVRAGRGRRPRRASMLVDAVGCAADVEDAGDAAAADDDGSRFEVHGGQQHHDAVHVREEPERHALVGHAVLQAQDGHVARRHRGELLEGRRRLMRLGGQHHDVVVAPVDVGGIARPSGRRGPPRRPDRAGAGRPRDSASK